MHAHKLIPPYMKTLVSVAVASLFIVGSAQASDYKNDSSKTVTIDSNANPTLTSYYFHDASSKNGGALSVKGNVEVDISDSKFESNVGTSSGGAVFTNGGQGRFYKVTFTSNASGSGGGGAIKFSKADGKYLVESCDFDSNVDNWDYGGAIYVVKNTPTILEIKNSTFTSNKGYIGGGAIANEKGTSLTFTGQNTFDGNISTQRGGAIYNNGGTLDFQGVTTFDSNIANGSTVGGGAIYNGGTIEIKGTSIFTNNLHKTTPNDIQNEGTINIVKGGVVAMDGGITGTGTLNIQKGGSLYFVTDPKNVTAEDSKDAVLSIDKQFNVTGVINVGDVSEITARASGPKLNLGNGSMLQLDGSMTDAALKANKGTLTIADGAKLYISNMSKPGEFTLANGFSLNGDIWSDENIAFSNVMLEIDGITEKDNGDLVLRIGAKAAASVFPNLIPINNMDALIAADLNGAGDDAPMGVRVLDQVLATNGDATVIDSVNEISRSALIVGVQNTALRLSDTASNTVLDRMSLAQRAESEGVNLWAVPMYGNLYSSGLVATGSSVRGQFGGVAIGADIGLGDFLGGKYYVGASFNVGGGQSKSKGTTVSAKNNFDFGGVNLYGAWTKGAFNVIGSLGYGYGNHELALGLPMSGFASADSDVDTKALTADLRAEYLVKTDVVDILPHVGVRYTALKTDSHDLKVDGSVLNSVKADTQYIVQFPIGVTVSKDFSWSDWTIKPMADLSVIPASGDKHASTVVNFSGLNAWDNVNTRVMDRTSWAGTFGLQARKGHFTLGMNYGVQHASNETDQNVQVKLNWMF